MTNNSLSLNYSSNHSESPFDQTRHIDENGNEFWYARELMSILGYKSWQKFRNVILVAQENVETVATSTSEHFLTVEIKSQGRPKEDYKLSRLACYHVALSCDSRGNDRVKAAKHYFAVKTREAETKIPQQANQIKELELMLQIEQNRTRQIEATERFTKYSEQLYTIHGAQITAFLRGDRDAVIEVNKPTIEVIDEQHNASFKGQTLKQIAYYLRQKFGINFKSGADLKRYLEKQGMGHLIGQTKRSILSDYVPEDNLQELYDFLAEYRQQKLIGE